jgi:hypothetical protein
MIEELLKELVGATIFSKIDLKSGYHQIRMVVGEEFKLHFGLIVAIMNFWLCPLI